MLKLINQYCQGQVVVSLGKKLYTDCSIVVGSRNGFESTSFYKLKAFFTIK